MLDDYTVDITYKNRLLESVHSKSYALVDYCQEQKLNLMHVIADVESAFYIMQDNKNKTEWTPEALECFQKIRHKLLDSANNIIRLPQNLHYKGVGVNFVDGAEYIASIVNKYSDSNDT